MTSRSPEPVQVAPDRPALAARLMPAIACAIVGAAVFQFLGNANRGYIDTNSLFYWWGYQWINPASETQHGWLILALSGWLFWKGRSRKEEASSQKPVAGRWRTEGGTTGLEARIRESGASSQESVSLGAASRLAMWPAPVAAMAGGLALHTLGFAAQQARVSIVALLVFTWGVVALAGRIMGIDWGRAARFPLAFMVFAIPINVLDTLGFWLRMSVIRLSSGFAHAVGIGVIQSGTQLLAPDGRYSYDVAAECSGVRSLMALSALSFLIGYLNFRNGWLRALVFLLCFPLVFAGNVVRITSIVFAAQWGGQQWGARVHEVMGYGVFAIVLGGVLGAVAILRRFEKGEGKTPEGCSQESEDGDSKEVSRGDALPAASGSRKGWLVAACVAAIAAADSGLLLRLRAMPQRGSAGVRLAADGHNPVDLPPFLGIDWIGQRIDVTQVERDVLPPDTGFSRKVYVPLSNRAQGVFLSIVLSGADRTSIHRPELCLVGQGWTIDGSAAHRFTYPGQSGSSFPATVLRVRRVAAPGSREMIPQLVVYWFVSGDAVVATHWQRLARDAWNRVMHLRADRWAYVLMQTDARDGEAAALARLQTVLDQTLPIFQPAK